ncbi:PREDICTED: thrombopoietin isoform X5 [Chinchilla lanigera]|uniref:thrombopoietin isoform X5 n=1 Tax=Chinchilla lanigera TaxID=34839 RepID=UPI00069881D3|nr:PREDICTED: thrombopoietin isoform X5 [Chinchilla lanigera]
MESPDGADQSTGHSRSGDPSTGGSDGSAGTAGTHVPLIPPGTAFWTGPPPPWGPAGPPGDPGQDHSSQGPQRHLPELPAAPPRKGAFPAACRRAHPLRQAGPAHHRCPKQSLSVAHTKQAPKQDFCVAGDELQRLSQNYWLWTSEQTAGIRSQDSWSAESDFQVFRPKPWTPGQDTKTLERNSWTPSWSFSQGPGSSSHSTWNFGHRLPATPPPARILCFPSRSSCWAVHTLLSFAHLAHTCGPAPPPAS